MAGPGICILYLADTKCSILLISTVYLFMTDIANPDLFVCGWRTWICPDITRFHEPSSGSAWLASQKNGKSGPHCWGRVGFDTICTAVYNRCDSSTACRLCRLEYRFYAHSFKNVTHSTSPNLLALGHNT